MKCLEEWKSLCNTYESGSKSNRICFFLMIVLYSTGNKSDICKVVPQSILPMEYGGSAGCFDDLAAGWKGKIESCQDSLLQHKLYYVDEELRPDDQLIVQFLRVCKYQLQQTKERIDDFCTMMTLCPEFLSNTDPLSTPEIQAILHANILTTLPNRVDATEPRILMMRLSTCNSETMPLPSVFNIVFQTIYLLVREDDVCSVCGLKVFIDCKDMPGNYILQANIGLLKKVIAFIQKTNPIRVKGLHFINVHPALEAVFSMIRHLFSQKTRKRVLLYNTANSSDAYKTIHKSILPKEYGGYAGNFDDMAAAWKQKIESCRESCLNNKTFYSNEDLRLVPPNALFEFLGIEGSFRKLVID